MVSRRSKRRADQSPVARVKPRVKHNAPQDDGDIFFRGMEANSKEPGRKNKSEMKASEEGYHRNGLELALPLLNVPQKTKNIAYLATMQRTPAKNQEEVGDIFYLFAHGLYLVFLKLKTVSFVLNLTPEQQRSERISP